VYVNTLMLQDVLAEEEWSELLTTEDRRGLTPLFWQHVLPYGEVKLDMTSPPQHPDRRDLRDAVSGSRLTGQPVVNAPSFTGEPSLGAR
jgi:Tn3 transposase DDE domain